MGMTRESALLMKQVWFALLRCALVHVLCLCMRPSTLMGEASICIIQIFSCASPSMTSPTHD